jgi:hypothetical protein
VILLGESWGAFLRNHSSHIAAMGWFVVPTIIARQPVQSRKRVATRHDKLAQNYLALERRHRDRLAQQRSVMA